MVSNNVVPMKLESSDRRYVVVRTSDSHMQDTEYFDDLAETLTSDFYNHLFSYFMTLDISKFNPRQIPHTEERQTLLEANKSVYELFIDETDFVSLDERSLYDEYKQYCQEYGYMAASKRTFLANVKSLLDVQNGVYTKKIFSE
ncbi:hypothetical protein TVAG_446550 [Trichomonas vaginalis G3]|nr:hypothetical protein TVAG_446550 [Trichomonas vaginalis G3]|eukprot:XP_001295420.1 hypothetical protein [Trichomonas vaginalis G3]